MTGPLRGLLYAVAITVTVLGIPFALMGRVGLGLWLLCGVAPLLWCLAHPAEDDDRRWEE